MSVFYVVIVLAAMAVMQGLVGGTRLLFSIPAYAILAIAALGSLRELKRRKTLPNGACLLASLAFFGYLFTRGLNSPVTYVAWSNQVAIGGACITYLLVACYLTDPRRRLWVVAGFLALAGLNLAIGARQFATETGYMLFGFLRSDSYLGRASGLYVCPNHLAGYLEVVGSLALALAFWSRVRVWIKLLFGYAGVCCFAGILMTGSRGGFLSAIAALLTLVILGLWRTREASPGTFKRALLAVLILGTLAAAGVGFAAKGSKIIRSRGAQIVTSEDARLLLWPAAIKQFSLSPLIGTGAGTYLYYGRLFRDPRMQMEPVHTHNDYLQLLGEYGAVGALGLLLFLAAHWHWGLKAYRHLSLRFESRSASGGSNAAALNIGALTAVVAISVHSGIDFNLHIPANSMLLAVVFAMLANPGRELNDARAEAPALRALDWAPRLMLPAMALGLLGWGIPRLPGEYYGEQARVALRDAKPMVAIHQAQLGLEREQNNPWLFYSLGEARQTMADRMASPGLARSFREASIEPYQRANALFPQDTRILLRLGQALTMTGRLAEAGEVMAQAVSWDPHSSRVQTYLGFYLEHAGKLAEARIAYQRALDLAPNDAAQKGFNQVKQAIGADAISN